MNANDLRPLLVEYRAEVEKGWTLATAHGGYEAGPGRSDGQCGPTSAWLQKRLWLEHGVKSVFTFGSMHALPRQTLRQHCWLETDRHRLILDLTADQLDPAHPVVCASPFQSGSLGLVYDQHLYMYDLSDQTDLLRRTALLAEAVGR